MPVLRLILLSLLFFRTTDPPTSEPCLDLLRNYAERLATMQSPQKGKMYYLEFEVEAIADSRQPQLNSKVPMVLIYGSDFYGYESPQMSYWADTEDVFMVIHPQKQILQTTAQNLKQDQARTQQLYAIQQLLFDHSSVTACRKNAEKGQHFIELTADEDFKKTYGVEKVQYVYRQAFGGVWRATIFYTPGRELEQQRVTYHKVDWNYRGDRNATARSRIYGADRQLLPKYRSYKLIRK